MDGHTHWLNYLVSTDGWTHTLVNYLVSTDGWTHTLVNLPSEYRWMDTHIG